MHNYRDDLLDYFEEKFIRDPVLLRSQMMGHPGFKFSHNNKFLLFCYEDGIVIKLPPEKYELVLERDDVTPFMPGNDKRPMSTWIVWSVPEPADYEKDWQIITWAYDYTATEAPNKKRKGK